MALIFDTVKLNEGIDSALNIGSHHFTAGTAHFSAGDNFEIRLGPNSSYSKYLYLGGWGTSKSDGAWVRTSNGNLHLEGANPGGGVFLNHYHGAHIYIGNGGGYTNIYNSTRSPIFYDLDNTTYYLNAASGNTSHALKVNGQIYRDGFDTSSNGDNNKIIVSQDYSSWIWNTATNWGIFWAGNDNAAYKYFSSSNPNELAFVGYGTLRAVIDLDNGQSYFGTSVRSPIFYDSDNTNYYVNPASTSNLNAVTASSFSGNGSGITNVNADTVDGYHQSSFFRNDRGQFGNSDIGFGATTGFTNTPTSGCYVVDHVGYSSNLAVFNGSGSANTVALQTHFNGSMYVHVNVDGSSWSSKKIWTEANDGSGSGLDADTVDGLQGSSLLRSDANDSYSGEITASGNGWYLWSLGARGASAGNYGIGNRNDNAYRQLTFHVPNQGAYSSSGTIPSFGWYSNGAVELMKLDSDSGNLWVKGQTGTNTPNGFRIDSSSHARIELDSNNNWSYVRLMDNGVTTWDIACYDSGNLEWRPGGSQTNRMTLDNGGRLRSNEFWAQTSTNSSRFTGAGDWGVRHYTDSGYIQLGPANTGHAHIYTDRSNFYFNKTIYVNGGSEMNTGDIRSAIFYDKDNTARYLDAASTSQLTNLTMNGELILNGFGGTTKFLSGSGDAADYNNQNVVLSGWNGLGFYNPTTGGAFANQTTGYYDFRNGVMSVKGSFRAPIFYDSDNTGYYCDPTGTSRLNMIYADDVTTTQRQASPRWDTAFYVLQAQHWYGDNSTQTMYVGEDNYIHLRDNVEVTDDIRSPIYYDRNDTTYYVNPASTSNMNVVTSANDVVDDEVLFAVTDWDTTESLRLKFGGTAVTKIDDPDAPASGVFKVQGGFNPTMGPYMPMDDETEVIFECWAKHDSGSDTAGLFYAGSNFYDGNKSYYGNTARYWGASSDAQDANDTGWRHIKGSFNGANIRASLTDASFFRFIALFNYQSTGNATRFCGFKFYRSKKTVSSLRVKRGVNDTGFQSTEAATSHLVIDNSGNVSPYNTLSMPYSGGGTMYLRQNSHWDSISGIDVIGGAGEFRFSSNTGNLNVRTDGWLIAHDYVQSLNQVYGTVYYDQNNTGYYLNPDSTSNLNVVQAKSIRNDGSVSSDDGFGIYWENTAATSYAIYREAGSWTNPYPDLRIAFHTGIKLGAHANYNGVRFYDDYSMGNQIMSVNNGSDPLGASNVYVNNSLQAGSSLRAPIFYDSNNTGYYCDPSGLTNIYALECAASADFNSSANFNGDAKFNARVSINTLVENGVGLKIQGGSNGGLALKLLGGSFSSTMAIETPTYGSGITFKHTGAFSANFATFVYGSSNVGYIQVSSTSTLYSTSSDYRLKENLVEITDGIERVKLLKPKRFNFIGHEETVDGFLAHEAQEVVPEAVAGVKDGVGYDGKPEYQGIDQAKLVPLLTAALQEAIAKIEDLESRLQAIENQ